MEIREDDLTGEVIGRFLAEHLANMHAVTPEGSVHALAIEGLRVPDVTFWSAWEGDELVGCGALKELSPHEGEIKSMRTAQSYRGRGVASKLLEHLLDVGRRRGYRNVHLETGSFRDFAPARALYERFGFTYRGPFGTYFDDPNTVFMTRSLDDDDGPSRR